MVLKGNNYSWYEDREQDGRTTRFESGATRIDSFGISRYKRVKYQNTEMNISTICNVHFTMFYITYFRSFFSKRRKMKLFFPWCCLLGFFRAIRQIRKYISRRRIIKDVLFCYNTINIPYYYVDDCTLASPFFHLYHCISLVYFSKWSRRTKKKRVCQPLHTQDLLTQTTPRSGRTSGEKEGRKAHSHGQLHSFHNARSHVQDQKKKPILPFLQFIHTFRLTSPTQIQTQVFFTQFSACLFFFLPFFQKPSILKSIIGKPSEYGRNR